MAEREGLLKRLGMGFDRYVGGLLGEDLSTMTPEERAAARRSAIGIIGRGMVSPEGGSAALTNVVQARAMQREREKMRARAAAAEQELPKITGRLFGGPMGAIESLEEGGAPTQLESRYRIDPRAALGRMYATQAGRDVAAAAPELFEMAKEGIKPTQYEFREVDNVGLFAINPADPRDMRLIQQAKKEVSPAQPQLTEVRLANGMVQKQWVLPGATTGTPLGAAYSPEGAKPLSDALVTKVSLAQSLRDAESEIAKLNPSIVTSAWATNRPERMKPSDLKQYEATATRWAQNLNYYKSGAQSGPAEVEANWKQYFPVAGDSDAEIALKNRQRRQEMAIIESVLRDAGVKDISLNPYPMVKDDKDPVYLRLRPGDIYMDSSGNYKRKV